MVFRADASKSTGYGHFIRSLALAGYLKDDFVCEFASFNQDDPLGKITEYQFDQICRVCRPLFVSAHSIDEFNAEFLKEIQADDIVVLDNYYYNTEYQKIIKRQGCKLVCIDDMHQYHMVCDLLFTPCPLKRENFSLESDTEFRGGLEWAFLREPFLQTSINRKRSNDLTTVVLAMGGADTFNLTDKMVGVIKSVIPDSIIDVVCGDKVKISMLNDSTIRVHHKLMAEEMVKLFDNADVGVFSASTVCIEALSRQLPVIAGYYVNNQVEFYNYGVYHNYFSGLGSLLDNHTKIEYRLGKNIENNLPIPPFIDFKSQKQKIIELFKSI